MCQCYSVGARGSTQVAAAIKARHRCQFQCRRSIFSVPPCMRAGIAGPRVHAHTHTHTRARTHTHAHVRSRTPPHTWDAQIAHHPLFRCTSTFHRQSTHFILSMPTPGPTTQHWHRHPLTLSLICTHMHDRQQMHAHILHSCVTGSRPCGRSLDCHLNLGKTLRRVKCICEVRPTHVSCRTTSRSLEARP